MTPTCCWGERLRGGVGGAGGVQRVRVAALQSSSGGLGRKEGRVGVRGAAVAAHSPAEATALTGEGWVRRVLSWPRASHHSRPSPAPRHQWPRSQRPWRRSFCARRARRRCSNWSRACPCRSARRARRCCASSARPSTRWTGRFGVGACPPSSPRRAGSDGTGGGGWAPAPPARPRAPARTRLGICAHRRSAPAHQILGGDVAGVVVEVGDDSKAKTVGGWSGRCHGVRPCLNRPPAQRARPPTRHPKTTRSYSPVTACLR